MRTVFVAGLVLLAAAACTPAAPSAPGAPGSAARETPPGTQPQTAAGSAGPSRAPTGAASMPAGAPELTAVPVRAVPACARATCWAIAVVPNARPGVHLALIRGPDTEVSQTAYVLSLDTAGRPLDWRGLSQGDLYFDPSLPAPSCDLYVHCFVAAGVGAHDGVMNVIAVGPTGGLTDASQGGELAADTPDIVARDLDVDGIAEILGVVNDYEPTYADGRRFWMVWSWRSGRYELTGCRLAQRGEEVPDGPVSPAACPT